MPRNMSFAMTTDQFRARTKTVTRRFGWLFLKPGDKVRGVERAMGLQKGEKIKPLGMIQIVSVRTEPLNAITQEDVIAEGFPDWSPSQFVQLLVDHYHVETTATVNRIQFEYIIEPPIALLGESALCRPAKANKGHAKEALE